MRAKKEKIILVKLVSNELWHSLDLHSKKLHQYYLKKHKSIEIISWSNSFNKAAELEIEKHFYDQKKIKIICIDPQIPIAEIIKKINHFKISDVDLIIHGYGDLIRQMPAIKKATHLNQSKIKMSVYLPSSRVCSAFKKIFSTQVGIIKQPIYYQSLPKIKYHLPFAELEKKTKKIGYVGRIEQTKNIIETIELLEQSHFFNDGEFFIAGEIDSHIYHYGQNHEDNDFILNLTSYVKSLDPATASRIHFLGHLESTELSGFIAKMNVMINLSTFYGECFGISVRQIIDLNVPLILSDWGGFIDIPKKNKIKFIKVSPNKMGVSRFNSNQFKKALEETLSKKNESQKINKRKSKNYPFSQGSFILKKINVPSEKRWNIAMVKSV